MKLNVGCGRFRAPGWVNIDNNPNIIADHVADLTQLPPQIQGVTTVYLGHILHLIPPDQVPTVLANLWQRCVSGAQVAAVGPDALRLIDNAQPKEWVIGRGGGLDSIRERLGGDALRWACTQTRLVDLIRASGLQRVRPVLLTSPELDGFPVVSKVEWQCAARGQVR